MVRFLSREDAIKWAVPKDAEILEDTLVYRHEGKLVVLHVFPVPNGCEDCADNWTVMKVSE
jgi:hypothetical protein